MFTALLPLHRGDPLAALILRDHDDPDWSSLLFTSWRAALTTEADVLERQPHAEARIAFAKVDVAPTRSPGS